VPARADLSVTLSAPSSAKTGSSFTYTLKVTNAGPDPAIGVATAFAASSGLKVISTSPPAQNLFGLLYWTDNTLVPATSVTYKVVVQVTARAGSTLTAVTATASLSLDPNLANNAAMASTKVTS